MKEITRTDYTRIETKFSILVSFFVYMRYKIGYLYGNNRCWSCNLFKTSEIIMKKGSTVSIIWAVDLFYLKFDSH